MGKTAAQMLGRPMAEAFPAEVFEQLAANDREVIASGLPQSFDELVEDARTGQVRNVWSHKFCVRDAAGAIIGLGGVSLDVTERERSARELRRRAASSRASSSRRPSAWSSAVSTRMAAPRSCSATSRSRRSSGGGRRTARRCRTRERAPRRPGAAPADDQRRDGGPPGDGRAALRAQRRARDLGSRRPEPHARLPTASP